MVYTGAAGTILNGASFGHWCRYQPWKLRNNPNYLGNRHERVRGRSLLWFYRSICSNCRCLFLNSICTGKILVKANAANILENTGSKSRPLTMISKELVLLPRWDLGALDITGCCENKDQVYLCYGGGTVGVLQNGMKVYLRRSFTNAFMVDKQGLLMIWMITAAKPFAKKHSIYNVSVDGPSGA